MRLDFVQQIKLRNAYRAVFDSPEGRVVLKHLVQAACISRPVASRDPTVMAMNAGKQELVLKIIRMINADDSEILNAIEENQRDVASD